MHHTIGGRFLTSRKTTQIIFNNMQQLSWYSNTLKKLKSNNAFWENGYPILLVAQKAVIEFQFPPDFFFQIIAFKSRFENKPPMCQVQ